MSTVSDTLAKMKQKDAEREITLSILRKLPQDMLAPTISNVRTDDEPLGI